MAEVITAIRVCPASANRVTAAFTAPRLSTTTVSSAAPASTRSRSTTGMPADTARARCSSSVAAGATTSPSTRRSMNSWTAAFSFSLSSSLLARMACSPALAATSAMPRTARAK